MNTFALPGDYALVLQQVHESGEEDFSGLAESLRLDRQRLTLVVHGLRQKGLIRIKQTHHDAWISLTAQGRRIIARLWPESLGRSAA
jgi:DNA-binding MarR family transcriptional regulator